MSTSAWLRSRRVERLLLAEESQGLAHWCGLISDQVAEAFGVVGVTSQVLSAPSYVIPKPETLNHKPLPPFLPPKRLNLEASARMCGCHPRTPPKIV